LSVLDDVFRCANGLIAPPVHQVIQRQRPVGEGACRVSFQGMLDACHRLFGRVSRAAFGNQRKSIEVQSRHRRPSPGEIRVSRDSLLRGAKGI
jgi:hypothetical protein